MLDALFDALPALKDFHEPIGPVYELLHDLARTESERRFGSDAGATQDFGPFGEVKFPFHRMGAITSLDLFGLDELIIFSFYWINRHRYSRVVDIGANLGLHSLVLDRCGCDVRCFEPDPEHFKRLVETVANNGCKKVEPIQAAISTESGEREFVRVLGNTTGSHLAGAKSNPYGELERFLVRVEAIGPLLEWADLLKIDAEGHEAAILTSTDPRQWSGVDAVVEVGTGANAEALFDYFHGTMVNLFAQKIKWRPVTRLEDMPKSYKDGSLFISVRKEMPWNASGKSNGDGMVGR